ncbi:MAG: hypothetical protein LUE29_13840 [Lachnospiraceae bacterium]|nr:hypothetical protein [Lachnospiraceae bacterium]
MQDSSDNSDSPLETDNPTVSSWFEFWMEDLKKPTIRQVTADGYVDIFNAHIKPQIGDMQIKDVRALHVHVM